MSLEDLGNIGEFVAAVAVVVSLVYLAVQVRQGSASVRATMFLTSSAHTADTAIQLVQDAEMARIYRAGQQDYESLTEVEQTRFVTYLAILFRNYEQIFQQDRMGLLDPEVWEGRRESMFRLCKWPGVRTAWQLRRHAFSKSFRDLVDAAQEQLESSHARQAGEPEQGQATGK